MNQVTPKPNVGKQDYLLQHYFLRVISIGIKFSCCIPVESQNMCLCYNAVILEVIIHLIHLSLGVDTVDHSFILFEGDKFLYSFCLTGSTTSADEISSLPVWYIKSAILECGFKT